MIHAVWLCGGLTTIMLLKGPLKRLEDVQPSLFETRLAQEYICFRTYLMVNFRGYMCVSLFFKYVFFYNPILTECLGKESLPR